MLTIDHSSLSDIRTKEESTALEICEYGHLPLLIPYDATLARNRLLLFQIVPIVPFSIGFVSHQSSFLFLTRREFMRQTTMEVMQSRAYFIFEFVDIAARKILLNLDHEPIPFTLIAKQTPVWVFGMKGIVRDFFKTSHSLIAHFGMN